MARGKKGRKSSQQLQTAKETSVQTSIPTAAKKSVRNRFYFYDYIIVCVFFILFCYFQKFVAVYTIFDKETVEIPALNFFFNTMWKGFIIVAVLVALHDFFYRDEKKEDTA